MNERSRQISAGIAFLASIPFALQAWVTPDTADIANTMENSRIEEHMFVEAAQLVDEFAKRNHRLPNRDDVKTFSVDGKFVLFYRPPASLKEIEDVPTHAKVVVLEVQGDMHALSREAISSFGEPPATVAAPYLLVDSSFDTPVMWASWRRQSSAPKNSDDFYYTGKSDLDMLLFGTAAAALLGLSLLLLRRWNGA